MRFSKNLRFPMSPARGGRVHVAALARLDAGLAELDRAQDRLNASTGTQDELAAANALTDLRDRLAARRAWVKWIEGDAFQASTAKT
jgi:hypothetical protein